MDRLAFSGWMASGKDTVAAEVMRQLGHHTAVRMSYAGPVREETRRIISLARDGASPADVAEKMSCSPAEAAKMLDHLAEDLAADPEDRTPGMRRALQYWGTDVRRNQDVDYWVQASLAEADKHSAEGLAVYYTDLRFPNEVAALAAEGYYTVRIDVERRTQTRRLAERDSLQGGVSLNHPSETSLDHYPKFHLRVNNDGPLEEAVEAVIAGHTDWKQRRALLSHAERRKK